MSQDILSNGIAGDGPHATTRDSELSNHAESKNYLRTAFAWSGSVTPQVMPRVLVAMAYSFGILMLSKYFPHVVCELTPFEYSGAVLGLLLVLRVNAGLDRWWEARKLWGSIVNQSRNLALIGSGYTETRGPVMEEFLRWVAVWPHVMRSSLRKERDLSDAKRLLGADEALKITNSVHMPVYVSSRVTKLLKQLRGMGLDDFAFQRAERERALLIDAIGACERILNTPIPLVLAIKTRRFILLYLMLLPMGLVDRAGWLTPLVAGIASYPLFSLDEIGAELQNPFSPRNLSHLPLHTVCKTIEANVLSLSEA